MSLNNVGHCLAELTHHTIYPKQKGPLIKSYDSNFEVFKKKFKVSTNGKTTLH